MEFWGNQRIIIATINVLILNLFLIYFIHRENSWGWNWRNVRWFCYVLHCRWDKYFIETRPNPHILAVFTRIIRPRRISHLQNLSKIDGKTDGWSEADCPSKIKPVPLSSKTYQLSDANYPTDNPSHTDSVSSVNAATNAYLFLSTLILSVFITHWAFSS